MAYVVIAVQGLLAVVFAVSVVAKVRSRAAFREFVSTVRRVGIVPERTVPATAAAVVVAEAATVLLVAWPATVPAGLSLAAALLLAFVAVTLVALRRRVAVPCRCFGAVSATPFGRVHLVRNSLLLAAVLAGAVALALGAGGETAAVDAAGVVVTLGGAVVAAVLLVVLDELVSLLGPASSLTPPGTAHRR